MSTEPRHIVDQLGGPTKLAKAIGVGVKAVTAWKMRNNIPVEYWEKIIRHSIIIEVAGVSAETLMVIHTRAKESAAA